jgi:hypothetical protein
MVRPRNTLKGPTGNRQEVDPLSTASEYMVRIRSAYGPYMLCSFVHGRLTLLFPNLGGEVIQPVWHVAIPMPETRLLYFINTTFLGIPDDHPPILTDLEGSGFFAAAICL